MVAVMLNRMSRRRLSLFGKTFSRVLATATVTAMGMDMARTVHAKQKLMSRPIDVASK